VWCAVWVVLARVFCPVRRRPRRPGCELGRRTDSERVRRECSGCRQWRGAAKLWWMWGSCRWGVKSQSEHSSARGPVRRERTSNFGSAAPARDHHAFTARQRHSPPGHFNLPRGTCTHSNIRQLERAIPIKLFDAEAVYLRGSWRGTRLTFTDVDRFASVIHPTRRERLPAALSPALRSPVT
jgi:hypothetical protein